MPSNTMFLWRGIQVMIASFETSQFFETDFQREKSLWTPAFAGVTAVETA